MCRALAKAHESGIVHRDLKPENVFLVHDDEDHAVIAKVVDFGIAKFIDPKTSGSSSTRTGAVLGTPQFMSPEQARGLRTVDHRTDLWSLGVIVYRALVGSLPFKGEAVGDLLVNICTGDPPVPSSLAPDVPSGFDAWVERALAREPADRFQSAGELSDSLSALCGLDARLGNAPASRDVSSLRDGSVRGAVTASPLSTTPAPVGRSGRPRPALLALLFIVVAGVAVAGARAVMHSGLEPSPEGNGARASGPPPASAAPPARSSLPQIAPVIPASAPPTSAEPAGRLEHRPSAATPDIAKRGRHRSAGGAEGAKPAAEKSAAKPSRPTDVLGY